MFVSSLEVCLFVLKEVCLYFFRGIFELIFILANACLTDIEHVFVCLLDTMCWQLEVY